MTWPANPDAELQRHYTRERNPPVAGGPATGASFIGTRVSLSSMARFEMGSGNMIDATDLIWFEMADYGGYVDIRLGDILLEIESAYRYAVITVDEEGWRLKVTVKATGRAGTPR